MRELLYLFHKYAGLLLGVFLALTGLSGSLLVFDHALDEVITSQLHGIASQPKSSVQQALESAEAAVPFVKATRIDLARQLGSPHTVRFIGPPSTNRRIEVSIDPNSAEVLVVREWGQYPMSWIYRFHYTLLAGDTGKTIVGFIGFSLMLFCASGLFLWWPRRNRWKHALKIVRRKGALRFYWDLHRVIGVVTMPILTLCAVTGIAMVFSKPFATLVGSVTTISELPSYSVAAKSKQLSLDTLIQIVKKQWPGSEVKRLFLPQQPGDSLRLSVNLPGEYWTNYGASIIWLNSHNGEILGVRDARNLPVGNTVLTWMFPLHNADVLGLSGRWLWVIIGAVPAFLFGSGAYLWLRKLGHRRLS
ncbi:PepSY-associated TM helix domain-containing protein [Dasania marina]|uniref:PepSY-associated TM helix domain-containing protein n=1 Tax=Dasania marina TaxID=471499 RepID=UPI0030DC5A0A|tara:strand:- start:439 stop:1521 length:1083 start_codon:yes stop_codon:yes gene_type:complete